MIAQMGIEKEEEEKIGYKVKENIMLLWWNLVEYVRHFESLFVWILKSLFSVKKKNKF